MSDERTGKSLSEREIEDRLELAERICGHRFTDRTLLRTALTHPSAVEALGGESFERLEFLGDGVVSLVVREQVLQSFPHLDEGGLTRVTIAAVEGAVMARVAQRIGLEDALILSLNELTQGSRGRRAALEDAYEAITAALYLEGGLEAARAWVLATLGPEISEDAAVRHVNPKAELQEIVQARKGSVAYRIVAEEGSSHERVFTAEAIVDGAVTGRGKGHSKRAAETEAARAALGREA